MLSKLQYISQGSDQLAQITNIKAALNGGCKWVQLRYKNVNEQQVFDLAQQAQALCKQYKATFIINDHVWLAKTINADGVHLGLDDMGIAEARTLLGPDKIIGGTANTYEQVKQRVSEQCDYIGLGPFRFTTTKEKLSPVLGINGYETIMQSLNDESIAIPVFAIGGIALADIADIISTGVHGIAISGLITNAQNKEEIINRINEQLYEDVKNSK